MTYARQWIEDVGSEDAHGRALWGLGKSVTFLNNPGQMAMSTTLFNQALKAVEHFHSPRAIAFALVGIHAYHGFSSPGILPVYKKYNNRVFYVSISDADLSPDLDYIKTIHHGIDTKQFDFQPGPDVYLLFFGRIHLDKGPREAIEIVRACNKKLILAGIIQDEDYYHQHIELHLDNDTAVYVGSAGPVQRNELLGKAYALLHSINFNEPARNRRRPCFLYCISQWRA